ncbi:hypothetical protein [Pollutimonas bauzanensis]|jgi:hypothetical protein|uniref:hypothetical protein n=1 Tax=Pollutimonas bauzanensis TaxID=658167 RepID=UPI003340D2BE
MSDLSYNQSSRFSDSLERDLMRNALSNGESVSIVSVAKKIAASVKAGFIAFTSYMAELNHALDEARAKDAHFSRSQW